MTIATRIPLIFLFLVSLPYDNGAWAFSSMAVPFPNGRSDAAVQSPHDNDNDATTRTTTTNVAPWRVVLDIGREPLSTMPFEWARSGGRMPIKIPCDFGITADNKSKKTTTMFVQPQSDTVSFTGPDGAVLRPIQGGHVHVSANQGEISFALTFPETLQRRDVSIPAGTTITCTAPLYTQSAVDALYQAFYNAREEAWALGGQLNDMMTVQGPPKVWNEATQTWDKRTKNINPWQWAKTRFTYAKAKAKQNACNQQRPDLNDLSARGPFPGMEEPVYVAKQGVAKTQTGAVIGKWSMEPILPNQPVSYRK